MSKTLSKYLLYWWYTINNNNNICTKDAPRKNPQRVFLVHYKLHFNVCHKTESNKSFLNRLILLYICMYVCVYANRFCLCRRSAFSVSDDNDDGGKFKHNIRIWCTSSYLYECVYIVYIIEWACTMCIYKLIYCMYIYNSQRNKLRSKKKTEWNTYIFFSG